MTKTLVHQSPIGALEIPTVLGPVEPGEPFDVDDDIANSLLQQTGVYRLASPPTLKQARALARTAGVDIDGLTTTTEIIAALAAREAEEAQQ